MCRSLKYSNMLSFMKIFRRAQKFLIQELNQSRALLYQQFDNRTYINYSVSIVMHCKYNANFIVLSRQGRAKRQIQRCVGCWNICIRNWEMFSVCGCAGIWARVCACMGGCWCGCVSVGSLMNYVYTHICTWRCEDIHV